MHLNYWFDLDLEPISFDIHHTKMGQPNVHLFDAGWGNISYMFIGGKPNQHVFQEVIERVINNIQKHIVNKKQIKENKVWIKKDFSRNLIFVWRSSPRLSIKLQISKYFLYISIIFLYFPLLVLYFFLI